MEKGRGRAGGGAWAFWAGSGLLGSNGASKVFLGRMEAVLGAVELF